MCPDSLTVAWTNWRAPQKNISRQYEERFYEDTFRDFASRMEWAEKGKGNQNPIVTVNGEKGIHPIHIQSQPGKALTLDASESYDPDGDALDFLWWIQSDAGKCPHETQLTAQQSKAILTLPQKKGSEIHVICEIHDHRDIPLVSYRRIIVRVVE